jgi:hypothetical protein
VARAEAAAVVRVAAARVAAARAVVAKEAAGARVVATAADQAEAETVSFPAGGRDRARQHPPALHQSH